VQALPKFVLTPRAARKAAHSETSKDNLGGIVSEPLVLSLEQAASLLGLGGNQLYQLTRKRSQVRQSKPIPFLKLGRRLVFRRESLERWIAELEASSEVR
jgi:excisionase family DNA binding protein